MADVSSGSVLLQKARTAIQRDRMIDRGAGVVVGVSGGPDSVALLHILHGLRSELDLWLVVAHLDHAIRSDSPKDADFVRGMSHELGINYAISCVDVRADAASDGTSVEDAGRRARYRFFEEVRMSAGAHVIATGHQRDDDLETLFLRILRGSSLTGLRGIPAVRGRIVRPLIDATRAEILSFLALQRIPYRIDSTNLETGTDRNFIRNRLFPLISERFPDFRNPVHRTLTLVREDEEFLNSEATRLYQRVVQTIRGGLAMEISELAGAPEVLASRVILAALHSVSGTEVRVSQRHLQAIIGILRGTNPSARIDLPGGLMLQREYRSLILSRGGLEAAPDWIHISVDRPGTVMIPGGEFVLRFRVVENTGKVPIPSDSRGIAVFDADKARFPLIVRSPRPGDRIRPWGMEGTRKIKKVLIDVKVPVRKRRSIPLLVKDDRVLWIPGIRRSREAPVTAETRMVLEVALVASSNPTAHLSEHDPVG